MAKNAVSVASAIPWLHPNVRPLLSDETFLPPMGGDYALPKTISHSSDPADKVNFLQGFIDMATRYSVVAAASAGMILLDEKEKQGRKFWKWAAENTNVSKAMARRYMALAESALENRKVLQHKSIRQALKAIGMGVERDAAETAVKKRASATRRPMTRTALRNHIVKIVENYPGALNLLDDLIPKLIELKKKLTKQAARRK